MSQKVLRFGPLPSKFNEDGSTAPRAAWDKFVDIPPDTRVRVVADPGAQEIYDGVATRTFSRDYEPGHYRYTMTVEVAPMNENGPGQDLRCEGDFYIDVTPAQWQRLQNMRPKAARYSQTTDGPTWTCTMPGCAVRTRTILSAFLHEANDHFGIDPIKEPDRLQDIQLKGLEAAKVVAAADRAAGKMSPRDITKSLSDNG